MDYIGSDFNSTGSVIPKSELTAARLKRGECPTCGRKCYKKKLFKMIPIDNEDGKVVNGRCLYCNPLSNKNHKNPSGHSRSGSNGRQPQTMQRSKSYHPHSGSSIPADGDALSSLPVRAMSSPPHVRGRAPVKASSHPDLRVDHRTSTKPSKVPLSEHSISSRKSLQSSKAKRDHSSSSLGRSFHSVASSCSVDSASCGSSSVGTRQSHPHQQQRYLTTPSSQKSQESTSLSNATSPEELQRAALLLVAAAKEHGLQDGGALATSLQDIVNNIAKSNKTESPHAATTADFTSDEDDETMKDLVVGHLNIASENTRVLDRGGAFPMRYGRLIYTGSTRTVSSMSSIDEGEKSLPTSHIQFQPPFRAVGKNSSRTLGSLSTIDGTNEEEFYSQSGYDQKSASASNITNDFTDEKLDSKPPATFESVALSVESPAAKQTQEIYTEETTAHEKEIELLRSKLQNSIDSSSLVLSMEAMELLSQSLGSSLHDPEAYKDLCVDSGLVGVLIAAMGQFPESPEIQIKICEILADIVASNECHHPRSASTKISRSQVIVEKEGAAEVILFSSMIIQEDDPRVQEAALNAMLRLCKDCEENQISFWKLDAIQPILLAMENHTNESQVQELGALVISILVDNPDNENARSAVGENGGIPLILRATSIHSEAPRVIESCMRALEALISECPSNIHTLLSAPGATKTILDVLRSDSQNFDLQEIGFAMLVKLTTLAEHTDLLLDNRGFIGEAGKSEGDIVEEMSNQLLEGLIETILETIQAHPTAPVIQDFGFAILANLTDSNETKMFIVDLGALDAIVLAMVLHKDHAGVQYQTCNLLLLLATQENYQHILAANPIELVKLAAHKYPEACLEPAS